MIWSTTIFWLSRLGVGFAKLWKKFETTFPAETAISMKLRMLQLRIISNLHTISSWRRHQRFWLSIFCYKNNFSNVIVNYSLTHNFYVLCQYQKCEVIHLMQHMMRKIYAKEAVGSFSKFSRRFMEILASFASLRRETGPKVIKLLFITVNKLFISSNFLCCFKSNEKFSILLWIISIFTRKTFFF